MASGITREEPKEGANEANSVRRVKQNRDLYVSKACNECRRRKVRCDGKVPCHRCTLHSASCSYDERTSRKRRRTNSQDNPAMDTRLSDLERQINRLNGNWVSGQDQASTTTPFHIPQPEGRQESDVPEKLATKLQDPEDLIHPYRGPGSSDFSFQVASGESRPSRKPAKDEHSGDSSGFEIKSIIDSELLAASKPLARLVLNDPLQDLDYSEVKRLVTVFNAGPRLLYPVCDPDEVLQTSERVFQLLRKTEKSQSVHDQILAAEELNSTPTITLKLVIANVLALESRQINRLAQRIFDSVREALGSSFWSLPSLRNIGNWVLVALLHFHLDEELQASRVAAHAARLCLEMGINRRDASRTFKAPSDALLATKLVWAVFSLDRRSSIALGIPFVIQDNDLDAVLQAPDADTLYLEPVVRLSRIAGEAWRLASRLGDRTVKLDTAEIDFLDYQISQWHSRLPACFNFNRADLLNRGKDSNAPSESNLYMNSILFLRANQLRGLLHRPALYSLDRIVEHEQYSRTAIDVACEAIQTLHELNSCSGIIQRHPVFFKFFLVSAFSSLILAISKAPVSSTTNGMSSGMPYLGQLKHDFYTALDLFKLLSTCAPSLTPLWESISKSEVWAVQMGLPTRTEAEEAPRQNFAGLVSPAETLEGQTCDSVPVIDGTWLDDWTTQYDFRTGALGAVNPQLANELWTLLDADLDAEANANVNANTAFDFGPAFRMNL